MDNSNKAIAKRINKELRIRGWTPADLLEKIIKFKKPNISKGELYLERQKKKGNFYTTLKGNDDRSVPKEDLYVISKIFCVSLEYLWFGEEKRPDFIPSGPQYAAYQDSDEEYRTYIAKLEHEDRVQYPDEFGFNLFDYFGQYDSINGYRYFLNNYGLYYDYVEYGGLAYTNSEGYMQLCCSHDRENVITDNLMRLLTEKQDIKTFKKVFFDNCSLRRFDCDFYRRDLKPLSDDFLEMLLRNEQFLELALQVREIDISIFNKYYEKGEKRRFIEPMFFEALSYALKNEKDCKEQLLKMLGVVLSYSNSQLVFINDYLKTHENEYGDVQIIQYAPRFLRSARNIPMGNVFRIINNTSDKEINNKLKEIEQCTFNMMHIRNEQEKKNEEIKILTPNNPLFVEITKKSVEQNVSFLPRVAHIDDEFTYYQYYESNGIDYENVEHLRIIIDCLNKIQDLVEPKPNKVLVHGNLNGKKLILENGKLIGVDGWQKCHYGNKFEDRVELLSNVNFYYYGEEYIKKLSDVFDVIAQDFNQEEKIKLVDKTINRLNERMKERIQEEKDNHSVSFGLKERASKLEYFKELYLEK